MRLTSFCSGFCLLIVVGSAESAAQTIAFQGACLKGPELTIAAGGDLLFHRGLQRQAYRHSDGSKRFFTPVAAFLKKADIAYANLEGPAAHGVSGFGRVRKDPGRRLDLNVYNGYPAFNYHPSIIDGLVAAGFDIVSTANNHSLDRGAIGVHRTIYNMNKRGLAFMGTRSRLRHNGPPAFGDWARIVKRKGFTTAWLACAEMTNGLRDRKKQVLMCHRDRKIVMREIRRLRARKDVDAVFLTPHWGEEYQHRPARRQRRYARAAIEAGATAVIGTHPHVIQPWEKFVTEDGREGLAIYSTGNFISGQVRYMRRAGILALLRLVRSKHGKVQLASAGYIPTWVTFGGGHRITANNGKRGGLAALRRTTRLLPAGNRVPAKLPFEMPNTCRPASHPDLLVASIASDRHPGRDDPARIITKLQIELARVGCASGTPDGIWGHQSRNALTRFLKFSGAASVTEPSAAILRQVASQDGRVCPALRIKRARRTVIASKSRSDEMLSHREPFGLDQ